MSILYEELNCKQDCICKHCKNVNGCLHGCGLCKQERTAWHVSKKCGDYEKKQEAKVYCKTCGDYTHDKEEENSMNTDCFEYCCLCCPLSPCGKEVL